MPAVSGSPTQLAASVTTLANLAGLPDDAYKDGDFAYVQSTRATYQLDRTSNATPSSVAVDTFSGNGQWVFFQASSSWTTERLVAGNIAWYVDSLNGDDENDGDVATPIQTLRELSRRLRRLQRGTLYTVHILNDIPTTDAIDLTGRVCEGDGPYRPVVMFEGAETISRTGTLTAANQTDSTAGATGTQASITAAAATWTPGEYVYFTSGIYSGHSTIVLKDMGAGVARCNHFMNTTWALTSLNSNAPSAGAPLPGDTFKVVAFPKVSCNLAASGDFELVFAHLRFEGGTISATTTNLTIGCVADTQGTAYERYRECTFPDVTWLVNGSSYSQFVVYSCCLFGHPVTTYVFARGSTASYVGCAFVNVDLYLSNRSISVISLGSCSFQAIVSRGRIRMGPGSTFGRAIMTGVMSFFDWGATSAIFIENSTILEAVVSAFTNIMGSGGAYGVQVQNGGVLRLLSTTSPKLQGTTADVWIDGLIGADNSATALIPTPTPGNPTTISASRSINGANGAGWTLWAGTFNRRAFSHLTPASVWATVV